MADSNDNDSVSNKPRIDINKRLKKQKSRLSKAGLRDIKARREQNKLEKPIGAPPSYRPELCEMLVEHMASGLSYETFAATIGTSRRTIYGWEKIYPEWEEAKAIGKEASRLFYEQAGRDGMLGKIKKFNAATFIFTMKCRFGDGIEAPAPVNFWQVAAPPKGVDLESIVCQPEQIDVESEDRAESSK